MNMEVKKSLLDRIITDVVKKKYVYGSVFNVFFTDHDIDLISASGNMKEDSQYYIASINKLFISSIVLKLYNENRLNINEKISKYLPENILRGLHIYKGRDFSNEITVSHLMSHTSGLPCFLIDKQANGKKAMKELEAGLDQPWPINKVIQEVKKMKSHFPPGLTGKARYSDTNYQILSLIIEQITGDSPLHTLNNLFHELNLTDTYVYESVNNMNFIPIRYKSKIISIPQYLSSTTNDIISTATDQMKFIKAFFNGHFFPKERMKELERWENIFFPFQYGIGIQKFSLPRFLSPFHQVPSMIGHCGSTGSVAFYIPDMDFYITGTVNQQARPQTAFKTIIKIVNKLRNMVV
jgi:CubicO group peptidase (beta-lactamase class C family)